MKTCEHGYGGFRRCPEGCHSKGPVEDYEALDRDITYFFKRLDYHESLKKEKLRKGI